MSLKHLIIRPSSRLIHIAGGSLRSAKLDNVQNKNESELTLVSTAKCFEGEHRIYKHFSSICNCIMFFSAFIPPKCLTKTIGDKKCPVLYYLSGLSSNHEKFMMRSGVQEYAAQYNLIIVNPDTSPRNVHMNEMHQHYDDCGEGASYYLDATELPWSKHFRMHTYVTTELIDIVEQELPADCEQRGICGNSMGGHGALICSLRNAGLYNSVSAFAPACNLAEYKNRWHTLEAYLGKNQYSWRQWDATALAGSYVGPPLKILLDQGDADDLLPVLMPNNFCRAAESNCSLEVIYKLRKGYNHSYFHVATFIEEHIKHHAHHLNRSTNYNVRY